MYLFWSIYCEISAQIFSLILTERNPKYAENPHYSHSYSVLRLKLLHFHGFHFQFSCWKARTKKLKEMFLQFYLQLLIHAFNLQHKWCSRQESKKKLLPFHLLHRCKANIMLSSRDLQLRHSHLHIRYKWTLLRTVNCDCKKLPGIITSIKWCVQHFFL